MIDLIMNLIGTIPIEYQWIVGICVIILFTFVTHIVFEVFGTLFNMLGGDDRGHR